MNTIDTLKTQISMKLKRQTAAVELTTQQLQDINDLLEKKATTK